MGLSALRSGSLRAAAAILTLIATGAPPVQAEDVAEPPILEQLRGEAGRLSPWVKSDLARSFLKAVEQLQEPGPRTLFRTADRSRYWPGESVASLPGGERLDLEEVQVSAAQYYTTKYGSPLAYVRAIDLLAGHGLGGLEGKRVLDFGYGTVGHLRLMALMGADAVGVDVDPFLGALYSRPEDQGIQPRGERPAGRVRLLQGRWPSTHEIRESVGRGYDLFISKNTLKRGYIHPEREADPRRLIQLGVDDAAYVDQLFMTLNPGGLAIIYNLSPPQSPPGEPYIPWADGRCPFERSLLEKAGFEVIEYDRVDDQAAREMARRLGWDEQGMDPDTQLFAHFTLLWKPAREDRTKSEPPGDASGQPPRP